MLIPTIILDNFFKEDWLLINVLNIDEIENKVKEMIKIENQYL
jgi:hypothetical protein